MLKVSINISPDPKIFLKKFDAFQGPGIRAGMINLVETIAGKAIKLAPVRTSNLAHSITSSISADGKKGEIKATAKYAEYVHRGTGLFGPFKMLIRPTTKKALFWPGAAHPVKSVKGQKPNPFFLKALNQVNVQQTFDQGINNFLSKI